MRHGAWLTVCLGLLASACASHQPETSPTVASGGLKVGSPYQINGKWYYPKYDASYDKVGVASWYGDDFNGLATADGEIFDKDRISAAHPTLPIPSLVRVTNLENGRSLVVRVNDRGPFVDDRLIDLSEAAARELGYERQGLAKVRVTFLGPADGQEPPPVVVPAPTAPPAASPAPPVAVASAAPSAAPVRVSQITPPSRTPFGSGRAPGLVAAPAVQKQPAPRVQLASAEACRVGPHFVQVGAFSESARLMMAQERLAGLRAVHIVPAFVDGTAVAKVRVGPVDGPTAAEALLQTVRARGYSDAFLTSASGAPEGAC
jgi:rare lipoprotein A